MALDGAGWPRPDCRTRAGLFGIAAVLTSLYPGIAVLLARV